MFKKKLKIQEKGLIFFKIYYFVAQLLWQCVSHIENPLSGWYIPYYCGVIISTTNSLCVKKVKIHGRHFLVKKVSSKQGRWLRNILYIFFQNKLIAFFFYFFIWEMFQLLPLFATFLPFWWNVNINVFTLFLPKITQI